MGKRQVGELDPQELVITILISAVATVPLENNGMPLANSLIPIAIFISLEIINSAISMKSINYRELIKGRPRFIIRDGKIQQEELKKLRYTIDDLTDAVRQAGIFDISQVANAIVETNGKLSVQKKSQNTIGIRMHHRSTLKTTQTHSICLRNTCPGTHKEMGMER